MNITVLALDGVFDTGLSTVLDAFGTANELAALLDAPPPPFTLTIAGLRTPVRTAQVTKSARVPEVMNVFAPVTM